MSVYINSSTIPLMLESFDEIDPFKDRQVERIERYNNIKILRCSLVPKTSIWSNGDQAIKDANVVFSTMYISDLSDEIHFQQLYFKILIRKEQSV